MIAVIDTNVPALANEAHSNFPACAAQCVRYLQEFVQNGTLVIDDAWRIVREYMDNLRSSGQPGVGDAFLKWVLSNQFNPQRCCRVPLTEVGGEEPRFVEFPSETRLSRFDPSDRKFVAVALAHPAHPPIVEALDSKWWEHREALAANGVTVQWLCPKEIQELHKRKHRA